MWFKCLFISSKWRMHSSIIRTSSWKKCKSRAILYWFYTNDINRFVFILQANLKFVPDFCEYKYNDDKVLAEISAHPTKLRNASLAIQLSYDWIRRNSHKLSAEVIDESLVKANGNELNLSPKIVEAIINCQWPGRCQTLRWRNMILYIDGAHTLDSLQLCLDWFAAMTKSRLQIKRAYLYV